jgi:hypothetical protein
MRAGHLKENVSALHHLGPEIEARVRRRQQANIGLIERAARMEWLDVRLDAELMEAIALEAGLAAVRRLNSDAITKTMEGPLLRPLVDGALKLFGFTPSSLVRWAGHAYQQIYRDCGAVEVSEDRCLLRVTGLPPALRRSAPWLEGLAGAIEGTIRVCRGAPRVNYVASSANPSHVDYHVAY